MSDRKVIDCRLYPSDNNCSVSIAGRENEVLDIATRHAVSEHGHADAPELRNQLRALLQDEG